MQSPTQNKTAPEQDLPAFAPAGHGRLTAEMETILKAMRQTAPSAPDPLSMSPMEARADYARIHAYWNDFDQRHCRVERFTIPSPDGAIDTVRVVPTYPGSRQHGTMLYLHGGGWVLGSTDTHRGAMARLASLCDIEVIGIDYRLAPESPFPAALDDCVAAWSWLRENEGVAGKRGPWFIAGDSAGANLALSMLLDLRDRRAALPHAALLFYGVYAHNQDSESHRLCGQGQYGLTSERMAWFRRHYLGAASYAAQSPRVAPLMGDLRGLPPLLVTAAEFDPLHDDSTALIRRALAAGVSTRFKIYGGVVHGFMQMGRALPVAIEAFNDAAAFTRLFDESNPGFE